MSDKTSAVKHFSFVIVCLTALSVTMQIAANLVSARTMPVFGHAAPLGVFFFPIVYVISDVTSDVYGYRVSRWIAWITVIMQLILVFAIRAIIYYTTPCGEFSETLDGALKMVFSSGAIIMGAGVVGAVLGGWANDIVFQIFRHKDGEAHFIKRKLWSSAFAEIVDTLVFITVAFKIGFGLPWEPVLWMYGIQFVMKYGVEVLTAPLARWCSKKIRDHEGADVFEDRNRFNLFGFEKKVKTPAV